MNIEIAHLPPMRRWQMQVADRLRELGHAVYFSPVPGTKALSFGVGVALAMQQFVLGPRRARFDQLTPDARLHCLGASSPDLTIIFDGATIERSRVVVPFFRGYEGDAALIDLLVQSDAVPFRVQATDHGQTTTLVSALLAIEEPEILSRALDKVLARIVTLVVQAVDRLERRADLAIAAPPTEDARVSERPLHHMMRSLSRKVIARLSGHKARGPNHWRIGYRRSCDGAAAAAWPRGTFAILPDDGDRFYADPIPFDSDGRTYVFFEDFPYATEKGVIGVVAIEPNGKVSPPRMVLEQSYHLSYPFIVRHQGDVFMLPEMSAAGRLQLFRADPFPDRWVPDRILLDQCVVADATPVFHEGTWWIFATLSGDGGSSWDQLGLFHAPDLFGPWTPHLDNPVLVDAGAARPAGAMWHEDGTLMRVAQDCRGGYGRGLAVCSVDRVDSSGYAQTVIKRLGPPDGYGADGVHTLARTESLEVIDLRFPHADRFRGASSLPGSSSFTGT